MVTFLDQHRETYGVEPICTVLPIAPSTYFRWKAQQEDPTIRSARAQRDDELRAAIRRVWDANEQVYGPRKVWRQLRREQVDAARCTVERLKELERENRELKRANEILKKASAYFAQAELDRRPK